MMSHVTLPHDEPTTLVRYQYGFKIRDVWYESEHKYHDADIVYYMQADQPVGRHGYEQYTILNDLTLSEEEIFSNFASSYRTQIRSAMRMEDYTYAMQDVTDFSQLDLFIKDYLAFEKRKKIPRLDIPRLKCYAENHLLKISKVCDPHQKPLVWHVYRVNKQRTMLLYNLTNRHDTSHTQTKNSIGKLSKMSHWYDMKALKNSGVATYDFCGWYNGKVDKTKLAINQFKERFGGQITPNYNAICYVSYKGKLVQLFKTIKKFIP